jgi:hypothetical protein
LTPYQDRVLCERMVGVLLVCAFTLFYLGPRLVADIIVERS